MTICKKCAHCVEFEVGGQKYHSCAASPVPADAYSTNFVTGEKMVTFTSAFSIVTVPYNEQYPDHKYLACASVNRDGKCIKYE